MLSFNLTLFENNEIVFAAAKSENIDGAVWDQGANLDYKMTILVDQ